MTREELSKMTPDQIKATPWNSPGFLFVPGRYYVGMYNIHLPKVLHPPYGGDVTSLLWRLDETSQEWIFCYRFRWYLTPQEDVEGKDRKSWYCGKLKGTEQEAQDKARDTMRLISGLAVMRTHNQAPLDFLEMKGDYNRAMFAMKNGGKSWLHFTGTIRVK